MSREQQSSLWPAITTIAIVLAIIVALPDAMKPWPGTFLKPQAHLGLDLAGGTQLDFRISEDEINARIAEVKTDIETLRSEGKKTDEKNFELQSLKRQQETLIEAIRTVLEKRINGLGVSEATITPSYFGTEKHLLVECPGIIDVNRCIATVGKTIRLEFKEEATEDNGEYATKMRVKADAAYRTVTTGTGNLQTLGQDLSDQLGITYQDATPVFVSALPKDFAGLANRQPQDPVERREITTTQAVAAADGSQKLEDSKSIVLTKIVEGKKPGTRTLTDPAEAMKQLQTTVKNGVFESKNSASTTSLSPAVAEGIASMQIGSNTTVDLGNSAVAIISLRGKTDGTEQMTARHILVQYKGASRADVAVIRSKAEAKARAEALLKQVKNGGNFASIASKDSDGPSKEKGGLLGTISKGVMGSAFDEVAFGLKQGETSGIVETPFGFHIIRAEKAAQATAGTASYDLLTFTGTISEAKSLQQKIEKGEVTRADDQIVVRMLSFSLKPTGWKDTELNGQRFRTAAAGTNPQTGAPEVNILFDEKGGKMFQELTKRNIGKRIAIFVGGELVSAPMVNNEIIGGRAVITGSTNIEEAQKLAQDLNTGAIPAPIYLTGQSTIEATLGTAALEQSVFAALVGLIVLCFFLIVIYRGLGVIASLALFIYVGLLVAAMKLPILLISNQYVVLSLAGIAGMILSMGIAVDANVLVFERMKEEVRKGKPLRVAIETGFQKAWPSVRDGNTSTLITCAILFMIGTSIIRGFAITLSIGILTSLFTAIVISRYLCRKVSATSLGENEHLLGVK